MKRNRRSGRLCGLVLACAFLLPLGGAHAKDPMARGFYVSLVGIGAAGVLGDLDNETPSIGGSLNDPEEDSDLVGAAGLAVGYGFAIGDSGALRLELMYDHRFRYDYDNNPAFQSGTPNVSLSSDISSDTLMFNVLYQFDVDWPLGEGNVYPYVGGGIGAVRHVSDAEFANIDSGVSFDSEETETNLAGSGNFGFVWQLREGWNLDLGYRFVYLGEVPVGPFGNGAEFRAESYFSHDVMLSIGYHF